MSTINNLSAYHPVYHTTGWLLGFILLVLASCGSSSASQQPVQQNNQAPGVGSGGSAGLMTTNLFPGPPNCTWWAWQRVHDTEHVDLQARHDAGLWLQDIENLGFDQSAYSEITHTFVPVQLNATPSVGDVVVVPHQDGRYAWTAAGHVAYVESIIDSDLFKVSQQDYDPPQGTYERTWSLSDLQNHQNHDARFIHILSSNNPPSSQPPTDTPVSQPPTDTPISQPPTNTPVSQPPTNTPPPPPQGWVPFYQQHRPFCDNSQGWLGDVNNSATDDCKSSNGLVLSQWNHSYAELDLDSPNGNSSYTQGNYQFSVQVGFLNPSDTSVKAAIISNTPRDQNQHGGYIVAINSQGNWEEQVVNSNGSISSVGGLLPNGNVSINPASFTITVTIFNGNYSVAINGDTIGVPLNPPNPNPGASGLMEESSAPTSSAILFSNLTVSQYIN